MIKNQYLFFSHRDAFEDKFDCLFQYDDCRLSKEMIDKINSMYGSIRSLCLCNEKNSRQMIKEYSKDYGFIIEYDLSLLISNSINNNVLFASSPIIYIDERNIEDDLSNIMDNPSTKEDYKIKSIRRYLEDYPRMKISKYSHEKETRLIYTEDKFDYSIYQNIISKIYLINPNYESIEYKQLKEVCDSMNIIIEEIDKNDLK